MSQQTQVINLEAVDPADVLRRHVKKEIPVDLEDLEIAALAKEHAARNRVLKQLEQKFADEKSEWREKIEAQTKRVEEVANDIDRGKQDRVVLCTELVRGNVVYIVREDNGAVYNTRALEMHESQRHLPAVEGGTGVLAQAAAAQKANNSETNEEGDVEPNDGSDDKPKRNKRK